MAKSFSQEYTRIFQTYEDLVDKEADKTEPNTSQTSPPERFIRRVTAIAHTCKSEGSSISARAAYSFVTAGFFDHNEWLTGIPDEAERIRDAVNFDIIMARISKPNPS